MNSGMIKAAMAEVRSV